MCIRDRNNRTGTIFEEFGALKLHNVVTADNLFAGIEFGITSAGPWLNDDDDYQLQDALIVGASENAELHLQSDVEGKLHDIAHDANEMYGGTRGIKGARSEKMRIKDVIFANFDKWTEQTGNGENTEWSPIGTCSHCEGPGTDSAGRTYFFKNTYFINSTRRVMFDTPFKEIIYDQDGTLGNSSHRWIVHYFKHLDVSECVRNENEYNGLLCSDSISIRRIVFHNAKPYDALKYLPAKVLNLFNPPTLEETPGTCPDANQTVTRDQIRENDNQTYQKQKDLLTAYHDVRVKTEQRDAIIKDIEDGKGGSMDTINTLNKEIETAETVIKGLEPEVKAATETNVYDELWKTDTQFCTEEYYQDIDFRFKRNPLKNWVFNVITGYEYNFHIGQGAAITELTGEYSSPELLQGETKGVILNLNHTTRLEAFNFTYTHENQTENVIDTGKDSALAMNSSTMGDVFFNNISRHIEIKFDGARNDTTRFVLKADKCISFGNCNPDLSEDKDIETEERLWSNPDHWNEKRETGKSTVPIAEDEVVIEAGWNMVYDLEDSEVFKSIEINGRLTILNNEIDRTLRSYLIFNRKGELIVGTEDKPFTASMTFELHGERKDSGVYFHTKMFEGGNKVIANTAKLQMYGNPIDVTCTRLAAVANAESDTITITDTPTTWKAGDKLGIAPSGRDWEQRDAVTIKSVSGNTITLNENLKYEHYGAASVNPSDSGNIDIRAEVVHLSRSIKVQGVNNDKWGATVVTAHNQDTQFVDGVLSTVTRKGYATIDHVEFVNCSQYDTDKAAVRFFDINGLKDEDVKSSVTNSAVHDGLGIGIMVSSAEDVTVDNNVVWFQHIGGIWMKKSDRTTITNNVVAGMGTRYWSGDTLFDEIAAYDLCNKDYNCEGLKVHDNVAAGGERVGFAMPTSCDQSLSEYSNNLAHSVEHGVFLFENRNCGSQNKQYFGNFKSYKTRQQGVMSYQNYQHLVVRNVETLDCGIGLSLMSSRIRDYSYFALENSVIMGESKILPKDPHSYCVDLHGVYSTQSTHSGKVFPENKPSKLPYHKIKSYSNWYVQGHHSGVTFKNWESGTRENCENESDKVQKIFFLNEYSADHIPIDRYVDTIFENVHNEAFAHLKDPKPGWAVLKECGNFPCTGPDNAIIKFERTNFIGPNEPDYKNATFQLIAGNDNVSENIADCTAVPAWNGFYCTNEKIVQLVFESLDPDAEERALQPVYFYGLDKDTRTGFKNKLNDFMDHCWDDHYTCQKRLSRFPGIIVADKKYEVYLTGTTPANSRYVLQGANADDYAIVYIDFSQSVLYHVYKSVNGGAEQKVAEKPFNRTLNKPEPLNVQNCGEVRYEQGNYIYEFVLRKDCTVYLRAQAHLVGLIRLDMTLEDFFEDDFVNKLAFVLGITTDQIRIVGVSQGSVVINYNVISNKTGKEQYRDIKEMGDKFIAA